MKEEFGKIGDLLSAALRRYNFDATITQSQVKEAYKAVVGEWLTKLTYSIYFDQATGTLHLSLASPALRQEYSYSQTSLMERINAQLPSPLVKKVVIK